LFSSVSGLFYSGNFAARIRACFIKSHPMRVLMNGLDAAGKTTILYKLKLGEIVTTIPTVSVNEVESEQPQRSKALLWNGSSHSG
jgi:ADP-ribosylation factor protein 1